MGLGDGLKQNSPLWFLPALFSTVCIYYFLIKLSVKHKYNSIILLFATIIMALICDKFLSVSLPMGINQCLIIGPIFYIGYLFKNFDLKDKIFKHFYYIIIITLLGVASAFINSTINYMGMDYGILPLAFISGLCLSVTCLYFSYKINSNKILEYIGRNTMGILIFHKLIIVLFQSKLGIISKLMKNSNMILELLLCLIVSALAIGFSIFVTNIIKKVFPILVGEKSQRSHINQ